MTVGDRLGLGSFTLLILSVGKPHSHRSGGHSYMCSGSAATRFCSIALFGYNVMIVSVVAYHVGAASPIFATTVAVGIVLIPNVFRFCRQYGVHTTD